MQISAAQQEQNPYVSIVVAIYNVGAFLEQCVQSLLAQTVQDLEIILVDDGSTDSSAEICDRFAREDSRVRVLHQENAGVSMARNNGMELCRGTWIMFVDGDDWMCPDGVEVLLNAIGEDPLCDVAAGTFYWNRPDYALFSGSAVPMGTRYDFDLEQSRQQIIEHILNATDLTVLSTMGCTLTSPWGKLYRKSTLMRHNIQFVPRQKKAQDYVFNLYVQQHARKLIAVNLPVYHYRIWDGSICEQFTKKQVPMDMILFWAREVDRFLQTYGYSDALRAYFRYARARELATIWIDQYRNRAATWQEASAQIRGLEEKGYRVALRNPYYSGKDRVFAFLLKYRLYRLFWMLRQIRNT